MADQYKGFQIQAAARSAKLVSTGELAHDMTPKPKDVVNEILKTTAEPVSGMNYLQIARNRGVVSQSMQYAISYLRNQLEDPGQVHTPSPNDVNWFHHDSLAKFEEETSFLDPKILADGAGGRQVWIHPVFEQLRQRSTCVWVVRAGPSDFCDITDDRAATHWCVIVANFTDREPVLVPRGKRFAWNNERNDLRDLYYDRSLRDVQFFDPLAGTQAERQARCDRLALMFGATLNRAGIAFQAKQMMAHLPGYNQVVHRWETGFQAYAIVQEYFRRLQLVQTLGKHGGSLGTSFWQKVVWADYIGLHGTDVIRESMMLACAGRAIAKSWYKARLALEIPGRSTYHNPNDLDPVLGPGVTKPRLEDPEHVIKDVYIAAQMACPNAMRDSWRA